MRVKKGKPAFMNAVQVASVVISLLAFVFSCITGIMQIRLAKQQAELEDIFKPINYIIEPSEEKCTYHFGDKEVQQHFPNIKFVTGRPREFSVIVIQDGEYLVAGCDMSTTEKYYVGNIKTSMPVTAFDEGTRYAYDYFFIYFEDAAGTGTLDMIYYQIDIQNAAVSEPRTCSKVDLLALESSADPYKQEMLGQYMRLLEKAEALPGME